MKKVLLFLFTTMMLCSLCLLSVFAKGELVEDRLIFEEDFASADGGMLPQGWQLRSPSAYGSAAVENGKLKIKSAESATHNERTILQLPSTDVTECVNLTYEVAFTIDRVHDVDTRFIGFMFRMRDVDVSEQNFTYYQLAVRKAANATSGVEFAKNNSIGTNNWTVVNAGKFSEAINPLKTYTAKVIVRGNKVEGYMNGYLIVSGTMDSGYEGGAIAIQISKMDATVTSVKVTENPPTYDYSGAVATYSPTTRLAPTPSVTMDIVDKVQLESLAFASQRPTSVILHVNDSLDIINPKDDSVLMSFHEAMAILNKKILPIINIKTDAAADAVIEMAKKTSLFDAFICSSDPLLVKKVRLECKGLRGIVNYKLTQKPTAQELLAMRDEVNSSWANIAILPIEFVDIDDIDYLQKRLITVWASGGNSKLDEYKKITYGTNGVVTDNDATVYECFDSFGGTTRQRVPYIAAHRGDKKFEKPALEQFYENTLPAAIEGYNRGADVIECDVFVTTDDELVIMHDENVGKYTPGASNASPETMTLAQVQAYAMADNKTKIPSMREYFKEFKDKDVVHFIEIKSSKPAAVDALKRIMLNEGVSSQVVVITFHEVIMTAMREKLPEISLGYLNQVSTLDHADIQVKINKFNATWNPNYSLLTKAINQNLSARGITTWPWTIDAAGDYKNSVQNGFSGITTNNSGHASTMVERVMAKAQYAFTKDEINIVGDVRLKKDKEIKAVNCLVEIIDGEQIIKKTADGKYYGVKNGKATVLIYYEYSNSSGVIYRMYSAPTTIEVTGIAVVPDPDPTPGPDPTPDPDPTPTTGCGSMLNTGSYTSIGVCAAATLTIILILLSYRRKKYNQ